MEQEQRITVEQTVLKLLRYVSVVLSVSFLNTVYGIAKLFVHSSRNEEVRNDVITFCFIIPKLYTGFRLSAAVEDIQVPLYHVSRISVLLINRLFSEFVAHLIILAVTDIISIA